VAHAVSSAGDLALASGKKGKEPAVVKRLEVRDVYLYTGREQGRGPSGTRAKEQREATSSG